MGFIKHTSLRHKNENNTEAKEGTERERGEKEKNSLRVGALLIRFAPSTNMILHYTLPPVAVVPVVVDTLKCLLRDDGVPVRKYGSP